MPIHPFLLQQLGVGALLEHLALAQDVDDIGALNRGETVRHRDRRPALGDSLKRGLHELLALCWIVVSKSFSETES